MLAVATGLALAGAAPAEENWYEAGQQIAISLPLTVTGPGCVDWVAVVPVFASIGPLFNGSCRYWTNHDRPDLYDGPNPVLDWDVSIQFLKPDWAGRFPIRVCDRRAGRQQSYCPRLPFVPIPERYDGGDR